MGCYGFKIEIGLVYFNSSVQVFSLNIFNQSCEDIYFPDFGFVK